MTEDDMVRAWKDPEFRDNTPGVAHPAGEIEFDSDDMFGGTTTSSWICGTLVSMATQAWSCNPFGGCDDTIFQSCGGVCNPTGVCGESHGNYCYTWNLGCY